MNSLSEELLDHIISEAVKPLPDRHGSRYADLVSVSTVSRKFHRITEPYLYCSIVVSEKNKDQFLQTITCCSELSKYTRELYIKQSSNIRHEVLRLAQHLPGLHKLDLDLKSCKTSDLLPVLQLPSVTALCLSGVVARQTDNASPIDWGIANTAIASLEMSFSDPETWWEDCDEIWKLAAVFRNLKSLSIHSDYEGERKHTLNGPVFRCLVHAFKHAFETNLRSFSFKCNDVNHDYIYQGDVAVSGAFDAREILKRSQLKSLEIDTMCLHRSSQEEKLRSQELGPSCLPASLRTLYLRHLVATGNLNPIERNLMHSDEAQCLSQLVNLGARRARFPNLEKMTLAISLPPFFEEVASRVVRVQARKVKLQLELILMSEWDYVSDDTARSWPEYHATRDPRHSFYDPTFIRCA
ncbi:hypothetical protein COCC4DRAFT_55159 [Bipolaris maydis ATCC 48331]|uniref:F-box domain-containing protein n=3 Tax=Cochliobolus heterostrophus TaxID=5016 RepID=M2TDT9_COCH5|nr:uncharacterized protein COCC4DRAFT_55159 [Bipolaris maydis ATCC 48331]EMD95640.1 hypothetical protein COCHEDRAFT_1165949 [Bipolaris maydis C5]ENI10500.1 hypothetical protein COCC4DRAFT_55159 [Bipolaris maydis ATCC 48331]KAJ6213556.1 hypothetical protein PSV09DRAFT_1165949 [Bipolaris maydis]